VTRVGLLGGTFNPPHIGHLVCAMEARDQLGLDVVRLIPAAIPPHKAVPDDPGVQARLELCRLAVAGEPGLEVSAIEADRPGPSYTVDTLRSLHDESPGDDLTFIVGGDMAHALPEWHQPEAILSLARLGVAEREDVRRQDVLERLAGLRGVPEQIAFFDMPRLDLSSSMLRRRVAAGRPIRHLVPDAVADRIASLGLYRVGAAAWA
jgi:nicotinate-nucleotide adenylyltransferase